MGNKNSVTQMGVLMSFMPGPSTLKRALEVNFSYSVKKLHMTLF